MSSFHFSYPLTLLLLLLVPPLLWWWARPHRGALRHPLATACRRLPRGRAAWAQGGSLLLRGLGLVLLILALAGPRWPDERTRIPTEGIAIGLVLDVSGSMAERDFLWDGEVLSRLEAVKRTFELFVKGGQGPGGIQLTGRPSDQVALVVFATRPEVACPLTLSHGTLLQVLREQQPREQIDENKTNIGDALVWALQHLSSAQARRRVLILFSDGEHNVEEPALKPGQAAQLARQLSVPIHVIDAGNKAAAQESLRRIAGLSRGQYFVANDTPALVKVCAEIDRLERDPIETYQYRSYHEGYGWFAAAAYVVWWLVAALELTWWRRVP